MPYTESGLWIPGEVERKRKVADRPHHLTVVLALLSPLIASGSIWYAARAVESNTRQFEIANRAFVYTDFVPGAVVSPKLPSSIDISIHNLGKTWASDVEVHAGYVQDGKLVSRAKRVFWRGTMPQEHRHTLNLNLISTRDLKASASAMSLGLFTQYRDLFGNQWNIAACRSIENDQLGGDDCDANSVQTAFLKHLVPLH